MRHEGLRSYGGAFPYIARRCNHLADWCGCRYQRPYDVNTDVWVILLYYCCYSVATLSWFSPIIVAVLGIQ